MTDMNAVLFYVLKERRKKERKEGRKKKNRYTKS
jgi:hypothetical protein